MSSCKDVEIQVACFTPNDGSGSVTVNHTIVLDKDGKPHATYFSDRTGAVIDEATYLGGGVASIGQCAPDEVECVESQEWTYGIDNTGTTFADTAKYELTLSDGTTLEWEQTPTSGWSQQLTQWATAIQTAADNAGLVWFVEPRFIDNYNPANIDGTINGPGGSPSGLPGAPTEVLAQGLFDGGMQWRYVNFQICPSQPVPVSAERIESATYATNPYPLTAAGPVLGVVQKFFVCRKCGVEPEWFLEDQVTLADAGQIPNCWEPCGFLSLQPAPPNRECEFVFDIGCDDNLSTLQADYTPDITRRATICADARINVVYFQPDPNDTSALIPYDIVGNFVDCATGEIIGEPSAECKHSFSDTLYRLAPETVTGTLRNREWHDTAPVSNLSVSQEVATANGRAFREGHDFSLIPDVDSLQSNLTLNDTDNTAVELDIQVIEGYIKSSKDVLLRYTNSSEGYWAVELGICSGELTLIAENGGFFAGREMQWTLPAGIHKLRLWNIDSGGSNSSATIQHSLDGGVTWVNGYPDHIELSTNAIEEVCQKVYVCEDTGFVFDFFSDVEIDKTAGYYGCPLACKPSCPCTEETEGDGPAPYDGPTAEDIAVATMIAQRDSVEGRVAQFRGNQVEQLNVAAGQRGNLVAIEDIATGLVYFTTDGTNPVTTTGTGDNRGTVTGPYHAGMQLRNIDLSQLRFDGSSVNSVYVVWYEVYT